MYSSSATFQEAKDGIVDLTDSAPEHIDIMLQFLYSGQLKLKKFPSTTTNEVELAQSTTKAQTVTPSANTNDTSHEVLLATNIYIFGDYWQIAALKPAAAVEVQKSLDYGWNSVEFSTSLKYIFKYTRAEDRLLTDTAIVWTVQKAAELLNRGEFVEVCRENAELSFEVMKAGIECRKSDTVNANKRCPSDPYGH